MSTSPEPAHVPSGSPSDGTDDAWLWLEDVDGDDALAWVRARNVVTETEFFDTPGFSDLRDGILDVLEADDRIDHPNRLGPDRAVRNFWTDRTHRRGLLRETAWDDYLGGDPTWDVLLDVDALGEAEGESWVVHGIATRVPDRTRLLIDLSPGGGDATVTREFDTVERRFLPDDEGGFHRPLAKGSLHWIDADTVYVASDFGPDSLTTSGYPRTIRRWRRGTPLADAPVVYEGAVDDVAVSVSVSTLPGATHHLFSRRLDFYTSEVAIRRPAPDDPDRENDDDGDRDGHDDGDGHEIVTVRVPSHVEVGVHGPWFTFAPREAWTIAGTEHPGGSLLAVEIDGYLDGTAVPVPVFTPTATRALAAHGWTRTRLVLNVMEDVRNHLLIATPPGTLHAPGPGPWTTAALPDAPDVWTLATAAVDADESDDLWVSGNDFVTPETLYLVDADGARVVRQAPHRFDADEVTVSQHFCSSADGTRIPYFQVGPRSAEGAGPTLLTAYGGFEVPRLAAYSGALGRAWLAGGRTYVLANIRGGGEYGPAWHRAGLRDQRHRVYEDFEAVARDLVERDVTTPPQLGISGGSNGGLLVGNMYVRTPELFGAVVCQVPLLDMARYHLLLAGASWMAEYGNPEVPDDWEFLRTFSPYHLIDPAADYPPILFTTSTRDDRVHPGHARKMAAALLDADKNVRYWENIEGGHGGAADAAQAATMQALLFSFLQAQLDGSAGGAVS